MCDKICTAKILEKSRQIQVNDIIQNGKNILFGKKVKIKQKKQNICKNCIFFDKKQQKYH